MPSCTTVILDLNGLGECAGLPVRGRYSRIGHLKVQQVIEVLEAKAANLALVSGRKLRVKAHVSALGVVEELAIDSQLDLGPDVLQKQALAPAMMGHDDIGREAFSPQFERSPEARFCANGLGLEVSYPRVCIGRGAALGSVGHQLDPLPRFGLGLLHGHGKDRVALLDQCGCQELELPGKFW
jgi:hypothetical protein